MSPDGVLRSWDARPVTNDIDGAFLEGNGIARLRMAFEHGEVSELKGASALRVSSPIARPNSVVCIGMNYAAHAAESGAQPPTIPVVFLKPNNSVAGHFDAAPIPPLSTKYDWEVELGVVIGRKASFLASVKEAADAMAAPGGQETQPPSPHIV